MEVRYEGGTATAYAPYQGTTYAFPRGLDVPVPEGLAALLLPLDDFVPGDTEAENYEPPVQTSNVPVRWRSDQQLITENGTEIPVAKGAQFAATYTGTEAQIRPLIDALPSGTEYVWNKTNGAGALLDIVSGVK